MNDIYSIITGSMLIIIVCLCMWVSNLKEKLRFNDYLIKDLQDDLNLKKLQLDHLISVNDNIREVNKSLVKELKSVKNTNNKIKAIIYKYVKNRGDTKDE